MKTVDLKRRADGVVVTLELDEFELATLVALVEQGQWHLRGDPRMADLHATMDETASEFCSLLGHLELLAASG